MNKQIRVVLAEDQAMVLGALAALLEIEKDIAVVARARNGREALTLVAQHEPDVLITDIEMPEMSGLTLAAEIHGTYPRVHIVILTTFARSGYFRRAMDAGAQGYMLKDRPAAELAECVRRVNRGLRVVDPEVSLAYWRDRLAFSVSEYYVDAQGRPSIAWMRRTTGSHDVAIGRYLRTAMHHVAYLVDSPLAVMRAADLMGDARLPHLIDFGPGRHGVSNAFYCYVRDPAGNRIEIFASDYQRDLDRPPIRWSLTDYESQGLTWWAQEVPARFREVTDILPGDWA